MKRKIAVIAHNIRSTHNVGSLFRTCDGLGVDSLYLTGYTPFPAMPSDDRLPHISSKLTKQIHKTALGAEETVYWEYVNNPIDVIQKLKTEGYTIAALEQTPDSQSLPEYDAPENIALILGEEVSGIPSDIMNETDVALEIPMFGSKESFNVSVATSMALYHFRFY